MIDALKTWTGHHRDADRRGLFVQPALVEAFDLTVIAAMTSGLPVFAKRHGGPLEITQHGTSGFHIDPDDGASAATRDTWRLHAEA